VAEIATTPNDQDFEKQKGFWPATASSDFHGGQVSVRQAWYTYGEMGLSTLKVGIIDDLVLGKHEDLSSKEDWATSVVRGGYDAATSSSPKDVNKYFGSHGTEMAGVFGSITNNEIGVAGIAGGTDGSGNGIKVYSYQWDKDKSESSVMTLVDKCISDEVSIINNSWVAASMSTERFNDAIKKGIVIVASRGNSGIRSSAKPWYDLGDDILWVGASGKDGKYKKVTNGGFGWDDYYSDYGNGMDVIAPGYVKSCLVPSVDVNDLNDVDRYFESGGSSGAAAFVTGLTALIKSNAERNNVDLNSADIRMLVKLGADDQIKDDQSKIGSRPLPTVGYDDLTGHGLINMGNSLEYMSASDFKLEHYDESDLSESNSTKVEENVEIVFYKVPEFSYPSERLLCNIWEVELEFEHSIPIGHNLFVLSHNHLSGAWANPNVCNLIVLPDDYETLYEYYQKPKASIERVDNSLTTTEVKFKGYLIEILGEFTSGTNVDYYTNSEWYPFDKNDLSSELKFEYTLHSTSATIGINDLNEEKNIHIWPNPNYDGLVNYSLKETPISIEILDANGKRIQVFERFAENNFEGSLNLSNLPSAIYFIKVNYEASVFVKKLICE
ncbi:MAG: S8 family serine peptidase, partial [Bacteroidetes bacterium]|nr:S8 family serine peptidase [Bacteroidota bacterium]